MNKLLEMLDLRLQTEGKELKEKVWNKKLKK
jgi:hypothetical protein